MNIDSFTNVYQQLFVMLFFKTWENVREVYVKEYIIRKSAG